MSDHNNCVMIVKRLCVRGEIVRVQSVCVCISRDT